MNAKQNGGGAAGLTEVQAGKPEGQGLALALHLAGPQGPHFENKGMG